VSLKEGENLFKIVAFNAKNNVESDAEFLEVNAKTSYANTKSKLFVLSVGIQEFKRKSLELDYAIADAKKVKFRTAEAAVNQLLYRQWGLNPVAMPWPDVPVALKQGVIEGLDHTPMVCNITKKFEVAKYYTYINYAQGLFIWIFNKAWFNKLPADLQKTFKEVVHDVCAKIRKETKQQELDQIAKAKAAGIEFISLPDADMKTLREQGNAVHEKYAEEINKLYPGDTYKPANYLKEVQQYMGY
jgi:TRAP-type mannitol/chloroaromatic compound transport system substrate-binding protein